MTPEIFEDNDFFHQAAEATAKRQKCPVDLVYACASGLDAIWNTPNHLNAVREVTLHLNDAARHARKLHKSLKALTERQQYDLLTAGSVTVFQIEHLASVLEADSVSLDDFYRSQGRAGGRNPAAYDVAEMMRRVFRRLRRRITFGTEPNSDLPSTEFGWAVYYALGDFGLRAGWRGPAGEAFDRHIRMQERLRRICEARRIRLVAEGG